MKRKIRLLAVLLVATTLSVFAQPDFSNEKIIESEQIKFQAAHLTQTSNALNNYDIIYNRCYWHADPAVNYIKGSVLTSFIAGANMNFIEFDFSPVLTVDSVVFHNTSLPFSLTAGDVLQISFPATLAAGTLDSVTVYYQGAPQSSGFGAYVQTTHNNTPVIWTLSEPYGAKSWWPCKQTLNDKIDSIDIIITTPSVYRAGSNGVLVSETVNGSDAVYHWSHRYPIAAYLVAFAVTNYAVYTDLAVVGNDTIEILNYVYPESLAVHQSATPAAIGAMQLFDSLFTPYPFINEKYGHAEIGGGASMEHQTMSFMSSASINHHVLSHELAHQWFGDQVTCGSWEDIWLNEGFASYGTGLTYQYMFGGQWWQPWKIQNVQNITSLPGGSVFCTDTTTVSRIFDGRLSYAKGAYFLHMLRWVVGDSAFFAGVKNYLNDTLLSYGYARTADFKSHMEAASGLTLTEFFYDWFYGEGHPSYLLTWGQDTLNNLSLTLSQTQSHPSVSFFEMPVPVRFANSVQDTVLVLNHTFSGQAFSAGINFKADSAFVDPELWIVSANNVVTNVADLKTDELVVQVKPNPFQSMLDIRVNSAFSGKINFELMNSLGQRVPVTVTSLNKSEYRLELTEDIPPGVYFIRCNNDENSFSKAVLKQ